MLDEARKVLRITTTALDSEITGLLDACKLDLQLAGISLERMAEDDPLLKRAMLTYVKANFGYGQDSDKFLRSYNTLKLLLRDVGDYDEL